EYALDKLDHESRSNLESFSLHRDRLTSTIRQYNAYQELDGLKDTLDPLTASLSAYKEQQRRLASLFGAARHKVRSLKHEISETEAELDQLEQKGRVEEELHQRTLDELDHRKDQKERERGPLVRARNDIERDGQG